MGFDRAAHGGYIPDVPFQDLELAKDGWSEVAIRTHAANSQHRHDVHPAHKPLLHYDSKDNKYPLRYEHE